MSDMGKVMPVPPIVGDAVCAAPQHLPLVDAAHARPGGPAAREMAAKLCPACPVVSWCFDWAMTHAEAGVWAGLSPNKRTRHGAPNTLPMVPDLAHRPLVSPRRPTASKPPVARKPAVTTFRLAELGVNGSEVKRWAFDRGLAHTISGRVSLQHVEAYAAENAA